MHRHRAAAPWLLGLLASIALGSPLSPPGASAQRRIVASLDATALDENARSVRFEWRVIPERADEEISCTIDVDVDDPGNVDASITDCGETTSFDHTYDEPGSYRAALTATSASGGSDRVIVTVVVR